MSASLPKVTVIICGNESEEGFTETLRSVESQLYPELAYLVVDGPTQEISPYEQFNQGIAEVLASSLEPSHEWVCCLLAGECFSSDTILRDVFDRLGAAETLAVTDGALVPFVVPFRQSAILVRLDQCHFDEDYRFAADYDLLYRLYHSRGASSVGCIPMPIAVANPEHPWRNYYSRYIKGEQLGIQSEHISWRWLKDYLRWKLLNR